MSEGDRGRDRRRASSRELSPGAQRGHERERRRSRTPPVQRAPQSPAVAWTRDGMRLLLVDIADCIKLVDVERLLIAHNRSNPAIRRGDVPPQTVLSGLLLSFKYERHHVGFAARYAVANGEDNVIVEAGLPEGDMPIPLLSVSSRNPFADGNWEEYGRAELQRLRDYVRRQGRVLTLKKAAQAAWQREAALSWYARNRADEDGLGPHLTSLLDYFKDRRELQRMERRFEVDQEAGAAPAAAAAGQGEHLHSSRERGREQREREQREREREQREREREREQREREREQREREREREQRERERERECEQRERNRQRELQEQHERQPERDREYSDAPRQRRDEPLPPQQQQQHEQAQQRAELPPHLAGRQTQDAGDLPPHLAAARAQPAGRALMQPAASLPGVTIAQHADDLPPHLAAQQLLPQQPQLMPLAQQQAAQPPMQQHSVQGAPYDLPPHLLAAAQQQQQAAGLGLSALTLPLLSDSPVAPSVVDGGNATAGNQMAMQFEAQAEQQQQAQVPGTTQMMQQQALASTALGSTAVALAPMQLQHQQSNSTNGAQQATTADSGAELAAARQAAVTASKPRNRDPRRQPGSSAAAAIAAAAAAAVAAGSSESEAASAAPAAGGKRKRAPIQWQPQESQPGDMPLVPDSNTATAKAAKAAADKGKQQQKAEKVPKGKQAGAPALSITFRNTASLAGSSDDEQCELQPAKKAAHAEAWAGGGSEQGAAQAMQQRGASAASWQQEHLLSPLSPLGQQQQHDAAVLKAAGGGMPYSVREVTPSRDGLPAFPPGFVGGGGGGAGMQAAPRAFNAGAAGDAGGNNNLTVRVMLPGAAAEYSAYNSAQQQHAGTAFQQGPGPTMEKQQQFASAAGPAFTQQAPAFQGAPLVVDEYGTRYAPVAAAAAASLAPSPADVPYITGSIQLQQLQQLQQQASGQLGMPALQHQFSLPQQQQQQYGNELPPHVQCSLPPMGGGYAAQQHDGMVHAEMDSRRAKGGSSQRRVELEPGGKGGAKGGGKGGGKGSSSMETDACWEPQSVWESKVVELLVAKPSGIKIADLHRQHPLPPCMLQNFEAYHSYMQRRKQLCTVVKSQKGREYDVAQPAKGAMAFCRYKRELLQLLADRRPRLEAGLVKRTVAVPDNLAEPIKREVENNFVGFVGKYLRDEVALIECNRRMVLELRAFRPGAGGPHFPCLHPPFAEQCRNHFCSPQGCRNGEHCTLSHAPLRSFAKG